MGAVEEQYRQILRVLPQTFPFTRLDQAKHQSRGLQDQYILSILAMDKATLFLRQRITNMGYPDNELTIAAEIIMLDYPIFTLFRTE